MPICVICVLFLSEPQKTLELDYAGIHTGRTSNGTIVRFASPWGAADLYLHATKADSFPNAVLESLACATPVVATAVGGVPEQIKDGQTGFLVPPNAPGALTRAIQTLLDDLALTLLNRACMFGAPLDRHGKQCP